LENKTKTIFIVIMGVILLAVGVFAGYLLIQRSQANQAQVLPEDFTVKSSVVVTTRDLSLGNTIAGSDVELASVPVEVAPRTAITSLEEVIGKIIKTDLVQGEMVLSHNLADPTNRNKDLSFVLSDDHVLLAFPGDDLMSRESMVQRGDIVDIFATFKQKVRTMEEAAAVEPETRTFTVDTMQKVGVTALVLDVFRQESNANVDPTQNSQPAPEPETRIRAYLLALNPRDALILKHLKDTGAIFDIVLRSPTSTVQFDLTPVTEEYIIEFYGLEILP